MANHLCSLQPTHLFCLHSFMSLKAPITQGTIIFTLSFPPCLSFLKRQNFLVHHPPQHNPLSLGYWWKKVITRQLALTTVLPLGSFKVNFFLGLVCEDVEKIILKDWYPKTVLTSFSTTKVNGLYL